MPAETCVAPVYAMDEVVRDPHLRHREMIVEPELPGNASRPQVGRDGETVGDARPYPRRRSRAGGEHGRDLAEIGYDAAAIEAMRAAGVVG